MRDRSRRAGVVAAGVAAAIGLAGCEVPMAPEDPPGGVLQGQWVACLDDGAADRSRTIGFYPDASFSVTTRVHATTDRTCGGEGAFVSYEAWRYRLGTEITAFVGPEGTQVLAKSIDLTQGAGTTVYSIVYVDSRATPAVLYFGDLAFDPALDGTAPEKRPDVLAASTALTGN
jgi:hypothetical protein